MQKRKKRNPLSLLVLDLLRDIPGISVHQMHTNGLTVKATPINGLSFAETFTGICRHLEEQGVELEVPPPRAQQLRRDAKMVLIRSIAGACVHPPLSLWIKPLAWAERVEKAKRALRERLSGTTAETEEHEVTRPSALERLTNEALVAGLSRIPFVQQMVLH